MKKVKLMVAALMLFTYPAYAMMSPKQIEDKVLEMTGGDNYADGAAMEKKFDIKDNLDGKFNCKDRAEIGKRIAEKEGYWTEYQKESTPTPGIAHRYVVLHDRHGFAGIILFIDYKAIEREQIREEVRRMKR